MNSIPGIAPQKQKSGLPLRYFIAMVIFIAMLPPTFLLSITMFRISDADRVSAEQRFVDNAQLVAGMVESAASAHAAMIKSLAVELDQERLIPVAQHFNGVIEITPPDPQTQPISTHHWHLGNLFDINPGYSARVRLHIPLDKNAGEITLIADAAALTRNIDLTAGENSSMLVAVVDGNGRVVARSTGQDSFIGQPVPTWEALLATKAQSGIFDAETIEGELITFGFAKINHTDGWAVVLGLPKTAFDARWQEPRALLIFGGLVSIGAALVLSGWMASLIVNPVTGLVHRARAILNNDISTTPLTPSSVSELNELQDAQVRAQEALISRAKELDLSAQRYRAMAKVGSLGTWRRASNGPLLDIEGWDLLTGQDWRGDTSWITRFHPDDRQEIDQVWAEKRFKTDPIELEFRVLNADDEYVWLRLRGAPILDEANTVVEWIGTFENIDERVRQHLHISHLAYHDSLTGLPNRTHFDQHLQTIWSDHLQGRVSALLFIDLDRFKQANDRYGHSAGDEILQQVADRLQRLIRPSDLVARLGGDEFAAVLNDVRDPSVATMVGMRIVKTLSQPYSVQDQIIEIGASVGIAILNADTTDLTSLREQADAALYRAKASGRNRCITYAEWTERNSADQR